MLKSLLSIFGIVGKATEEQTQKSRRKIQDALARRLEDPQNYTPVFAYGMRAGMMSTKISCYAVGFSTQRDRLAVVPIHCDSDEIEDLMLFEREDISSITVGMQGEKIIKSPRLDGDLRLTVPGYTREDAEDMYQLPIVQMEEVAAFEKWIKENF